MARRRARRSRWRRHRAYRRLAIAILLVLGLAALAEDLSSRADRAATTTVAVAAAAIPPGSVLAPEDVSSTDVDRGSPLAEVGLGRDEVVGQSTVGLLAPGEMITAGRLADPGAAPTGTTVMPVPFPNAETVAYLTAGTVLDVLWIPDEFRGGTPRTVAHAAVVLPDPVREQSSDRPALGDHTVLLRIAEDEAVDVAAALGSGRLSVLLRPG